MKALKEYPLQVLKDLIRNIKVPCPIMIATLIKFLSTLKRLIIKVSMFSDYLESKGFKTQLNSPRNERSSMIKQSDSD